MTSVSEVPLGLPHEPVTKLDSSDHPEEQVYHQADEVEEEDPKGVMLDPGHLLPILNEQPSPVPSPSYTPSHTPPSSPSHHQNHHHHSPPQHHCHHSHSHAQTLGPGPGSPNHPNHLDIPDATSCITEEGSTTISDSELATLQPYLNTLQRSAKAEPECAHCSPTRAHSTPKHFHASGSLLTYLRHSFYNYLGQSFTMAASMQCNCGCSPHNLNTGEQEEMTRSDSLLSLRRVFTLFHEANSFVQTGYRKPCSNLGCALASMFTVHNETGSIWIHLIGAFAFLFYALCHRSEVKHTQAPELLLLSAVCCVLCFFFSTAYHLFRFMSRDIFKFWLQWDHMGCAVLILGSNYCWLQLLFACHPLIRDCYTAVLCCGTSVAVLCHAFPANVKQWLTNKLKVKDYELSEVFLVPSAFSGLVALIHYLCINGYTDITQHGIILTLFFTAAFAVFITKVPERYFPRRFDIWGNSHQLWHLLLVIASAWHMLGVQQYGYLIHAHHCGLPNPTTAITAIP
jgi:adiponectin receptor